MKSVDRVPKFLAQSPLLSTEKSLEFLYCVKTSRSRGWKAEVTCADRTIMLLLLRINASCASGCRYDVRASTIRRARCHGSIRILST